MKLYFITTITLCKDTNMTGQSGRKEAIQNFL